MTQPNGFAYWNPVKKAGHIRYPKLDSLVCKTGFDMTGNYEET
jgi:hypothetical protein